ncbi:MAG: hypothetical protein IKY83_05095 [Proteobacteria bacterium]|nr:hypothetical protein [Pseudomonadota bacterium]
MVLIKKKPNRKSRYERFTTKPDNSISDDIYNESLDELYEAEVRAFETPEMVCQIFKNALNDVEQGNFRDDLPDIDF